MQLCTFRLAAGPFSGARRIFALISWGGLTEDFGSPSSRGSQGEGAELFGVECHLYCGKLSLGDGCERPAAAASPGRGPFVGRTEDNEETVIVADTTAFLC